MNKLIRDGKVAVLYSPEYGGGWFSWNSEVPQCIWEPELVEMVLNGAQPKDISLCAKKLYGENFYTEGVGTLEIVWLPEGTQFMIDEYDGFETVRTVSFVA